MLLFGVLVFFLTTARDDLHIITSTLTQSIDFYEIASSPILKPVYYFVEGKSFLK